MVCFVDFIINVNLVNKMYKNLIMSSFTTYVIEEIKKWYHHNTQHLFKSSSILSFNIEHIKDNYFKIFFSYDTVTLPYIEESLTNPDLFGKRPLTIGETNYIIVSRRLEEDIKNTNLIDEKDFEESNESLETELGVNEDMLEESRDVLDKTRIIYHSLENLTIHN